MGNCIRKESSTHWGGEEWGSFTSNSANSERLLSSAVGAPALPTGTEMKIKISKKQLEQLLKNVHVQDRVSPEQVLAQLLHHSPPWRPALHTIPE
ncbi:hypothetical protein C2S52_013309 [Perilla frutescens var. hirtella]|uniref:Uncharacterized protein n=1 Tax=Perilla frutescens var. hirtella TaxID=608512 RepID=A0AAD4JKP0_PERFH|nr:hypothetical protein C2S51_015611 [Perilla frutescens var. frutescens]KAH6775748.1 hypothetical protein C2S52_013309 [Perilla frutescens var. hirtella]KAH6835610.1 hypothetical protein C2S53_007644 [Perilla frutescens var. hirtella]